MALDDPRRAGLKQAMQAPTPAATLILLRDRPGLPPEVPMVVRGAHLVFAANRLVFPGGRVDPDDEAIVTRTELFVDGPAIDPEDLALRVTAIRETIEEIGLAPGMPGIVHSDQIAAIREALHRGQSFSGILAREGLRIDPHGIHPFARWLPGHEIVRRFDTRFYIARAPLVGEAVADGSESSHCIWGAAEDHLNAGSMIFPTRRNLERIGQVRDFDDAVAFARRYPIPIITPWIVERDGDRWLTIPDDLGYPVTEELADKADRELAPSRPSSTRTPG